MDVNRCFCLCFGILLFMAAFSVSSSSVFFVSDGIFKSQAYTGRSLLQAIKSCPVNFESVNYTGMMEKCRPPKYKVDLCCSALKDIACPHVAEINDMSNDCAATMFSYINLYGNYPPRLFASVCREGKDGLACPIESPAPSDAVNENSASITAVASSLLILLLVFSIVLFKHM